MGYFKVLQYTTTPIVEYKRNGSQTTIEEQLNSHPISGAYSQMGLYQHSK